MVAAVLVGIVAGALVAFLLSRVWRESEVTGERCETCGVALTTRSQVEVREDQTGDPAAEEIAAMGGGSFLAAYYCRAHAPRTMVA